MNILLTGATGFLGSHVLKGLLREGHDATVLKRSQSHCDRIADELKKCRFYDVDRVPLDTIFREQQFEAVIHCATEYGKNKRADQVTESNLIFPLRLLEAAIFAQCPHFINTDSFFTKQVPERIEKGQELYFPEYTLSKYQFREWGKMRASEGKVNFINLQMEHIYGPDDRDGKFVTFLIQSMQRGVKELDLTDGIQIRDFIYVDDAASAYLAVLEHLKDLNGYCNFEVGTGISHTIRELAETVRTKLGAACQLNFGKKPRTNKEIMYSTAQKNSMKKIGFVPLVTFEAGMKRTVSDFGEMEQM